MSFANKPPSAFLDDPIALQWPSLGLTLFMEEPSARPQMNGARLKGRSLGEESRHMVKWPMRVPLVLAAICHQGSGGWERHLQGRTRTAPVP